MEKETAYADRIPSPNVTCNAVAGFDSLDSNDDDITHVLVYGLFGRQQI